MITFQRYFERRVEELLNNSSSLALFIFRGLEIEQIKYLVKHDYSILNDDEIIENNTLNIGALDRKRKALNLALMTAEHSLVGFYEELITIVSVLKDITASFDGKIIIIDNDLFPGPVPSCIPFNVAEGIFDYIQEDRNEESSEMEMYCRYYTDVKILPNEKALLFFNNVHKDIICEQTELFKTIPLSTGEYIEGEEIIVGTERDYLYRLAVMDSNIRGINIKRDPVKNGDYADSLIKVLRTLGIPFSVSDIDSFAPEYSYDNGQFLPWLKKYWGNNASFRDLKFYCSPDTSKEIELISQGSLVSEIVEQCELAKDGEEYRDIFITAPTGAGKSLLFQLPALYIAEKYDLVTIVISPLIALMNDQVAQLRKERGVTNAACINSSISFVERQNYINEIHSGKISIIYLAPELLLSTGLTTILGERKLGLLVIDEVHTVTSWGRDFRSDYWFLGDFLRMVKRNGTIFPVLCLTATAVYSGPDDVVDDTIAELALNNPVLHLGNVKRTNIQFEINNCIPVKGQTIESVKQDMLIKRLSRYSSQKERTLAYCPFALQVEQIYAKLQEKQKHVIRRYHGGLYKEEKNITEKEYRSGNVLALICTKAFGMGVDRSDIKHIIHYAPTGNLADYVQEVGRAARDLSILGTAHMDFFPGDMRYVRTLHGLSEMKQFQLKAILKKLSEIYHTKKKRNLLIAPESFSHLFQDKELETKVKCGLLMLAKDLRETYGFPVLIVRPRVMLTRMFISVPDSLQQEFLRKFGLYSRKIGKMPDLIFQEANGTETRISYPGTVYSIRIGDLWEKEYSDLSFGSFKWMFFQPDFMQDENKNHLVPRMRVLVKYHIEYEKVREQIEKLLDVIIAYFTQKKNAAVKTFDEKDFVREIREKYTDLSLDNNQLKLILDMMTLKVNENIISGKSRNAIKVLQKRKKQGEANDSEYIILNSYMRVKRNLLKLLFYCRPTQGNEYSSYVPYSKDTEIEIITILNLLEISGLASYELHGGERAEIFVRINDPEKIDRLAEGRYQNKILQEIRRKHVASQDLLQKFFLCNMSNEERWDFIESYFLGRTDELEYYFQKYGKSLDV